MTKDKDAKKADEKTLKTEANPEDLDEIAQKSHARYGTETCPICHSRYDEYGFCACGAGGN